MAKREKVSKNLQNNKIFINCPFDEDYLVLLRPMLFSLIYLGYDPLIASHSKDSGKIRIEKILELIESSDTSIHDISRVEAKEAGDSFRMNMPFEFGLDWANRRYKNKKKKFLVLESVAHSASRALSDFSGCDPESHGNKPEKIVKIVRDWFSVYYADGTCPGGYYIWDEYNLFTTSLYDLKKQSNKDIESKPISELITLMKIWVAKNS